MMNKIFYGSKWLTTIVMVWLAIFTDNPSDITKYIAIICVVLCCVLGCAYDIYYQITKEST